jgi:hypothetical protein
MRWIAQRTNRATTDSHEPARWLVVTVFAGAMAWVEAAVVYDLRTLTDRLQPYQQNPLPLGGALGRVEIIREIATLVMLLAVGLLAGRTWRKRMAYGAIAFGVWDVLYYAFLKVICDWPTSLLDWDVLFLLPFPWWGPVVAPLCIALLMIVWGTLASQLTDLNIEPFAWRPWALNGLGSVLALYVFMADSIRVANQGADVWRNLLPSAFNWPVFCVALILMAAPVVAIGWRTWLSRPPACGNSGSSVGA